ncbi:MAG: hypothetical protein QOI80_371, partial [Solirubrobacteraceae bacterium]|nr:hypothetical protein [Solirubrobacteraceae bacterium]
SSTEPGLAVILGTVGVLSDPAVCGAGQP